MSIRPHILSVTLLVVLLAGCATVSVPKAGSVDAELTPTPPSPDTAVRMAQHDDENPIQIKTDDKSHGHKAEVQPGSGKFIDEQAARAPVSSRPAAEGQVTFNFENQPIQAVVQAILGSLLKENYTVAPNVTGNVTFSTSRPITPEQAMPILEMLLAWTNNTMIRKEGRYEVLPVKDAIPGNLTPRIAPPNIAQGYEVRVYPLKYIAATEMQKLLKPFAKADAVVSADNARNMIIMAGTASELANYQRSIEVFDVDWLKGMSVGVYSLRNTDVTKIMPELDKIFGATGESPLAGMFRFIPMDTTNSIVVITPQPDYLKQAETWLYRLDIGVGENGTQLYVYDVKNVKAVDLSDHLNAIYTGRTSTRSSNSGNVAPGMKAVSIGAFNSGSSGVGGVGGTNSQIGQGKSLGVNGANTASNLSTTGTGTPNAAGQKETDIRITPIEENNQLLIMATPGEWDSILSAIHRLDISPLQVQIEAKILEVTLDGDLEFGVQWWLAGLINTSNGVNSSSTGYTYNPPFVSQNGAANRQRSSLGGSSPPSPNGGSGLFYSFLNKNFQVALNSLQTSGNTKILSTPSLVVMNNQEAQITVGTQVPVISTSIIGVTGVGTTTSTAENSVTNTGIGQASYISTGITLDIKPRVNPGGLVYMDVQQQDTAPGNASGSNPNPPINQRNLQTQVAVQSGETVLLGGMIQDTDQTNKSGVPLLSSIPLLGNLFGNTSKTHHRTELIVLITPRVIYNADDARQMTTEYEKKFESLAPLRAKDATEHPAAAPAPPPLPKPEQLISEPPKVEEDKPGEK
ncbi:MAG: type II secretion system secretin GspD [Rudaea sp.]|nr:type II secretion system secretin GspD [Rudaea sp.]